jgi:hypothetical protein
MSISWQALTWKECYAFWVYFTLMVGSISSVLCCPKCSSLNFISVKGKVHVHTGLNSKVCLFMSEPLQAVTRRCSQHYGEILYIFWTCKGKLLCSHTDLFVRQCNSSRYLWYLIRHRWKCMDIICVRARGGIALHVCNLFWFMLCCTPVHTL